MTNWLPNLQRGAGPLYVRLADQIERDIEKLLRRSDRDDYDPYVLPGDAIACYDSTVTNIAEVGRIVGSVAGAALLIGN